MKTATISAILKSDLIIVELPEGAYYEVFKHGIYIKDDNGERGFIEGSYTLLGSPDEISDEDARELVHLLGDKSYTWVNYTKPFQGYCTALESFFSALETVIFWNVNPLQSTPPTEDLSFYDSKEQRKIASDKWHEAEKKTFDRKRTIIFKKN